MTNAKKKPRIAAVILAAGRSQRFGSDNKLLATVNGQPMIRLSVLSALGSQVDATIVVTGYQAESVTQCLSGLDINAVHNPDYATGMASSLRVGVSAAHEFDAVLVLLADMPQIGSALLDTLIHAFVAADAELIIAPVHDGRRGNPVLWPKRYFSELIAIKGDTGARHLLKHYVEQVHEVDVQSPAIFWDVDTQTQLDDIHQAKSNQH